jgi:hypothetical protein
MLNLEISADRKTSAKKLFSRAIQECPWSKGEAINILLSLKSFPLSLSFSLSLYPLDLYLYAFKDLRLLYSDDEYMDLMKLMSDKGLRCRALLEEIRILRYD